MATHDDPTTTPTGESPAADGPVTEDAPKAAPKRRRATKKAAAPVPVTADAAGATAPGAEAAADDTAAGEADADVEAAPTKKKAAKKAARKATKKSAGAVAKKSTRSRKAAAPVQTLAEVEVEPETEADGEDLDEDQAAGSATEDGRELVPGLDAQPSPEQDDLVDEADEEPAAPPAAAPSFGLLFQAPDASAAPRRRRATAPAQAPAERPATQEAAEAVEPEQAASTERDEDEQAQEPQAGRGARTRGSRTRRSAAKGAQDRASSDQASGTSDSGAAEQPDSGAQDRQDGSDDSDEAPEEAQDGGRRRRRGGRGRRGRGGDRAEQAAGDDAEHSDDADSGEGDTGPAEDGSDSDQGEGGTSRRRRRRRRSGASGDSDDPPGTVTRVREPRKDRDEPTAVKGSTRLEAKKQRRREGREAGRRRTIITEAEFLARRESVERVMAVRGKGDKTQIGVLEDGVLVEHYVSRESNASMAGNVYLGRVQNVLPSMEAAFVDIGKGRNAVLYAGEVNWDAAGLEQNQAKRIENALGSGDTVLVQVTKDPIGHKGARLTSQISLPGRYLVYVPEGSMTGISRKLPDTERARLKAILKEVVPDTAGVIVRTAAEGASEEELRADVERLTKAWDNIQKKVKAAGSKKAGSGGAPVLLHGEADLTVRVIRDVFTEDFSELVVSGDQAWAEVSGYVEDVAPDLARRLTHWTSENDLFTHYRVDEQIAKAMDRKVWLPSGGSLVIDRTEAMTVVDVNTGKFVGSGGNLEETVTKNNIEAAEEIVRQLRLRDIGGIIVIDFIDMVLESNRDLVVRRLLECLGRDRTKHQVAEVTSLGLVQMTRKRVGSGLIEVFSEQCEHCAGRGIIVQGEPIDRSGQGGDQGHSHASSHGGSASGGDRGASSSRSRGRRGKSGDGAPSSAARESAPEPAPAAPTGPTAAQIAAAAHAAAIKSISGERHDDDVAQLTGLHDDAATPSSAPAPEQETTPDQGTAPEQDSHPEPATAPEPDEQPASEPEAAPVVRVTATSAEREPVVVAQVGTPDAEDTEPVRAVAQSAPIDEPVVRPRRKRGRVVAPAGPPRGADAEQAPSDAAQSSEPAPADLEQVEGDR